ncbi:MAG: AI-2E family transporter [Paenibacillaceae bacterium]|uniref:AI-2E family transporter n=1 Tax=Paenibacillus mellifer TaxID=2937794 RepID=A0A9X2BSH0_9BACL|nr:AI-2E family transporter [Paenibacillus mellifer]MBW4840181.1 AI-2E family transporter [Paenibacillaceae bacterium]MCK8486756.1 AI-2E family transporter [Paenibacillus mellifer]
MWQHPFYRTSLGIILVLTIIYLLSKVSFIFNPVVTLVSILIVPLTISGFLYYLLRPIVHFLESKKLNRMLSILLIYLMFAGVVTIFLIVVWPPLQKQIIEFMNNVPKLINGVQSQMNDFRNNRYFSMVTDETSPELMNKVTEYLNSAMEAISGYLSHVVTFLNDFVIVVGTVPILLYYMLKEDERVTPALVRMLPVRYRRDGASVIHDIDNMLKGFIAGRMISAVLLAFMSFIGFWLIGLPYPLLLAVVGALFNFIPYFGALLGAIPCVIVAFTVSPSMVVWVILIVVLAQQVEGNLISPYIYGKTINIHPLTTIVLLLVASDFGGILGMILAIPVYMMLKIVVLKAHKLYFAEKIEELTE